MRINPYYRLKYLSNVPYLICFGQANADFCHDYRLDDTSVFLWEHMEKAADVHDLTQIAAHHYNISPNQYTKLEEVVRSFTDSLYRYGILLPEYSVPRLENEPVVFSIAGLYLRIWGPTDILPRELLDFACASELSANKPVTDSALEIVICSGTPSYTENGTLLLRNRELCVTDTGERYILFFPSFHQVTEAHIQKDGNRAFIYYAPGKLPVTTEEMSFTLRMLFLYYAQLHHMTALHSASILYNDRLWLFSGPSGTGKSTHARLWQELYDAAVINGDLNLIAPGPDGPVVHGIPWCGTSGIYNTDTYPLGGIIFLRQAAENKVHSLSNDSKQLLLLHRSPSPAWTCDLQDSILNMLDEIYEKVLICRLDCRPDAEAATLIKQEIDQFCSIK